MSEQKTEFDKGGYLKPAYEVLTTVRAGEYVIPILKWPER